MNLTSIKTSYLKLSKKKQKTKNCPALNYLLLKGGKTHWNNPMNINVFNTLRR